MASETMRPDEPSQVDWVTKTQGLRGEIDKVLAMADSSLELEKIRVRYLGQKGLIKLWLAELGTLPESVRPEVGRRLNQIKSWLAQELSKRRGAVEKGPSLKVAPPMDVTLPGRRTVIGHLHPLTQVLNQVVEQFASMGFEVGTGPDVETDFYNFEALNIPPDHPARDMQDTFYIRIPSGDGKGTLLLRTHTSPVQIRWMKTHEPPFRMIAPGRVFRRDLDTSHSPVFHQVEGLMVGSDVSLAHLKGVLGAFARGFFGPRTRTRLRPSYFPFTEPSSELDVVCVHCGGKGRGCRICKGSGWLEILGCGMVHPAVFRHAGYGKKSHIQGFAFGLGIERLAMIRYKIPDIRLFYQGDVRFLAQF